MTESPLQLEIDRSGTGVAFWIHVTPRARKPRVGGLHTDALRVAVAAPPFEGKANAACSKAIAAAVGSPRSSVLIDPASKGRRKRVRIEGDPGILVVRLNALALAPGLG